jgi:hypothetical protein
VRPTAHRSFPAATRGLKQQLYLRRILGGASTIPMRARVVPCLLQLATVDLTLRVATTRMVAVATSTVAAKKPALSVQRKRRRPSALRFEGQMVTAMAEQFNAQRDAILPNLDTSKIGKLLERRSRASSAAGPARLGVSQRQLR